MRASAPFYAISAVVLLMGAGCDQATTRLPTDPSAAAIPAPAIPEGEIIVLSVQPETGATLTAEECDGGCFIDDFRLTLDVRLDRDVAEPWVTVSSTTVHNNVRAQGTRQFFRRLNRFLPTSPPDSARPALVLGPVVLVLPPKGSSA